LRGHGNVENRHVGVMVELQLAGRPVRALPDPTGGSFDSAGDFDRLIERRDTACPVLGSVDPYGETRLVWAEMGPLIQEIDRLLVQARPGPEEHGLTRLRVLALHCSEQPDAELVFIGD
jgi:hypothetical protein